MENATKALLFTASTLIAVMLFAFMFYMFRRFSTTAHNTEERMSRSEIDAFNSKFLNYDTGGLEGVTVTHVSRTVGGKSTLKDYKYSQIFGNPSGSNLENTNPKDYYKALVDISQTLNTPVDLVTAINDAIDVNYKNNNNYLYNDGNLEIQNSVEIIVNLGSNNFKFSEYGSSNHYKTLVIEPNKGVKPKNIYGVKPGMSLATSGTNTQNKEKNAQNLASIFNDSNAVSVYDMLAELKDTKLVPAEAKLAQAEMDRQYTVYKYYFKCDVYINEFTDLVETLKFTLIEDKNF